MNREHGLQERSDYEIIAGYCERDGLLRDEIQTRSRGTLFEWQRRFCEPTDGQWKVFSQTLKFFKIATATPTYGHFRVKNNGGGGRIKLTQKLFQNWNNMTAGLMNCGIPAAPSP